MNKNTLMGIVALIIVAIGGWYWWSMQGKGAEETPTVNTEDTAPSGQLGVNGGEGQTNTGKIKVDGVLNRGGDETHGFYVTATNGMTLYMYTKDAPGVSNCSGQCAVNWPPYIVDSKEPLMPGSGVAGKLDTITRDDGKTQLTYNSQPLYFYIKDVKAGDMVGQNVGGVWFVVKP